MKANVAEPSDDIEKSQRRKNNIMTRKILIDFIKDYLVPIMSMLSSAQAMLECLQTLYVLWIQQH